MGQNEIIDVPRGELAPADPSAPALDLLGRSDVEQMVAKAEFIARKLQQLQGACIKSTFPSDWIIHGSGDKATCYLEGDGGLRMAPILGLEMLGRPKKIVEDLENGVQSVTYVADFRSKLFGNVMYGVEKTRRTDDDFLARKKKDAEGNVTDIELADVEDVASAAYKSLFSRASMFLAGLSGLRPVELQDRFGFTPSGATINYRTGGGEAKAADVANADENVRKIQTILRKLYGEDTAAAAKYLAEITKFEDGSGSVTDPRRLSAKRAEFIVKKVQAKEKAFDAGVAKNEGAGGGK
jgi:hypothetical protein